jgi:cytochrome c-type biogenesis protein CcmH/NrfG
VLGRLLAQLAAHPWRALRARRAQRLLSAALAAPGDERTLPMLERVVTLAPEDAAAWSALGDVRLKGGDPEKAAVCYHAALRLTGDPAVELRLGRALRQGGSLHEAIGAFRRA